MYKSTAASQQFSERSGSFSTHSSRTGRNLLGGGEEEILSPIQKRDVLIANHKKSTEEIVKINEELQKSIPLSLRQKLKALKRVKGIEYQKLCFDLKEANEACGRVPKSMDIGHFLIEVMKERLTRPEWELVKKEAEKRFDAQGQS